MIFEQGGLLSKQIKGYEERQGQIDMANDLEDFIMDEEHKVFIAEAPVGVGKSMAYLLPFLLNTNKTLVVSTSSITLQNQLVGKDLKDAQEIVKKETGKTIKYAALKGIGNYVCLSELNKPHDISELEVEQDLEKIRVLTKKESYQGQKPDEIDWRAWNLVTTTSNDCPKRKCNYSEECYYLNKRRYAQNVDVLVVNHALLAADAFIQQKTGGMVNVIPPYDYLVVDEIHELESSCTGFFTKTVSRKSINRLLNKAADVPKKLDDIEGMTSSDKSRISEMALQAEAELKSINFAPLFKWIEETRMKMGYGKLIKQSYENEEIIEGLKRARLAYKDITYINSISDEKEIAQPTKGMALSIEEYIDRINNIKDLPENIAVWVEGHENYPKIKMTPIEVSGFLENVWEDNDKTLMTSATITVNGEFSYMRDRLGITQATKTGIYQTPFDYKKQAKLIIPKNYDPKSDEFNEQVYAGIEKIIQKGYDKTLILFTSYKQMDELRYKIKQKFNQEYLVLEQSKNMSKDFILKNFRNAEKAILIAQAASFGTGVDVKGDKNIILVKLNFDNPSDPLVKAKGEAIKAKGGNDFMDLALPEVCIKTKQQIGRGVRSSDDRAIIAIFDGRIVRSHWGKKVLRSMPNIKLYKKV